MKIEVKGKVYDTEDSKQLIALCGDYRENKNYYYEKVLYITFNGDFIQEIFEKKEVKGKKKPEVKHEAKVLSQEEGKVVLKASGFNPDNLGLLLHDYRPASVVCPSCAN